MALFDKTTTHADIDEYIPNAFSNSTGAGGDENFQIDISESGYYGLVVYKTSSADYNLSGSYQIAFGPPSVTVTYPDGGEIINAGQKISITWDNFGNLAHNVKIEISRDSGSSWLTIIPSTPNDGAFTWFAQMPGSTQCRIRVTSNSDPSYTDTSDADFTIDASGIPAEINLKHGLTDIPSSTGSVDFGHVNLGWDKT